MMRVLDKEWVIWPRGTLNKFPVNLLLSLLRLTYHKATGLLYLITTVVHTVQCLTSHWQMTDCLICSILIFHNTLAWLGLRLGWNIVEPVCSLRYDLLTSRSQSNTCIDMQLSSCTFDNIG